MRDHMSGNVLHAFATPILQRVFPDTEALNDGLASTVLAKQRESQGTNRSNVGGWQSTHDLLRWGTPEITQLNQMIHDAFGEVMEADVGTAAFQCKLSAVAWANINTHGDYNRVHTHGDNHWSGVYYVCLGEPDPSRTPNGAIEFLDPRGGVSVGYPGIPAITSGTVSPVPGLMLLFPSWLNHGVLPFFGAGERISIAFNLKIRELQMPG
jgi:uncharacterized protein (TIGR02466 family)